jgi:hypothetical protein
LRSVGVSGVAGLPLVYGQATPEQIADPQACQPVGTALANDIVGFLPASGLVTDNLGMQATQTINVNDIIRLVQWNDNGGSGLGANPANANDSQFESPETLVNGISIFVQPDQTGAFACTAKKIIKMTFSSSGGESTPVPFNFAYVTPQFTSSLAFPASALTAELNTDVDFATFSSAISPLSNQLFVNGVASGWRTITVPSTISVVDSATLAVGGVSPTWQWIDYATNATGTVSYVLTSAASEPGLSGVGAVVADGVNCTSSAPYQVFTCASNTLLTGNHTLVITTSGNTTTGQNNPTSWTISNIGVSITTAQNTGTLCGGVTGTNLGSWYGGIEAIVPFVTARGPVGARTYDTFIKLYNRYSKDAKVYVTNLNKHNAVGEAVVTSIESLSGLSKFPNSAGVRSNAAIPSGGYISITTDDLADNNSTGVPTISDAVNAQSTTDLAQGQPIKFLIRVPAQMGNPAFTTFGISGPNTINVSGDSISGSAAGVATASNVDPYISGIVVQTFAGGQRTIPLLFKSFKQGQYN